MLKKIQIDKVEKKIKHFTRVGIIFRKGANGNSRTENNELNKMGFTAK